MNEPIGGPHPGSCPGRKIIATTALGIAALILPSASADAGAMRHQIVYAKGSHSLTNSSADIWGTYWQSALKNHWREVHSPRAMSIMSLSADGTLPASPFAEYLLWRQSVHTAAFNTFHPEVAKLLKKIKYPSIPPSSPSQPGGVIPPGTKVPILPPDFTPYTPGEGLIPPPQVPEPASGVMALVMIGGAVMARRWARRAG